MENRIQELRKRKKLSQEELAEKLEVTRQTIISLEKGRLVTRVYYGLTKEQYFADK